MLQHWPSLVLSINKKGCGAEPTAGAGLGGAGSESEGELALGGGELTTQCPLLDV